MNSSNKTARCLSPWLCLCSEAVALPGSGCRVRWQHGPHLRAGSRLCRRARFVPHPTWRLCPRPPHPTWQPPRAVGVSPEPTLNMAAGSVRFSLPLSFFRPAPCLCRRKRREALGGGRGGAEVAELDGGGGGERRWTTNSTRESAARPPPAPPAPPLRGLRGSAPWRALPAAPGGRDAMSHGPRSAPARPRSCPWGDAGPRVGAAAQTCAGDGAALGGERRGLRRAERPGGVCWAGAASARLRDAGSWVGVRDSGGSPCSPPE